MQISLSLGIALFVELTEGPLLALFQADNAIDMPLDSQSSESVILFFDHITYFFSTNDRQVFMFTYI
jgi:hypothetical protein